MPLYRQEVSLYSAVPSMALSYGQSLMDGMHERTGTDTAQAGVVQDNGSWARVAAQHASRDGGPLGIYGDKGPSYQDDMFALQAGVDLYRGYDGDGSRDISGVYVALGEIAGDVKHFDGSTAGHDQVRGYTLGGYWTHFGPSGWYTDAVIQGTGYNVKASSTRMAPLKTSGRGLGASLEGGYAIALSNGWAFVPQAQVVYQRASFNDASDAASGVSFNNVDSLAGRVGSEVKKTWAIGSGRRSQLVTSWLRADLWREFMAKPGVEFSNPTAPVNFRSDLKRSWVGLRAGVGAQLAPNVFAYANVGYDVAVNDHSNSYGGRVGIRINW